MTGMHHFKHEAMNGLFEIFIEGDRPGCASAAQAAWDEIDRLELDLSRFVTTSDITRVNSSAGKRPVRIGLDTWEILLLALGVWQMTGGAFDVTWGSAAKPTPGTPSVLLDESNMTAYIEADRRIDLGAIGKGYALDAAGKLLREWGFSRAILTSAQSTILVLGEFEVDLRDPSHVHQSIGKVKVADYAVSGSGTLFQGAHIIDPVTGRPATGKIGTWAAAPSGAVSDALSTAFMVMPPGKITTLCEEFSDIAGLTKSPDGAFRQFGNLDAVKWQLK